MMINYKEIPAFSFFVSWVRRDYERFRKLNPEITGKKLQYKFSSIIKEIYQKYSPSDIFLEKNGTLGNFKSKIVKEIRRIEREDQGKVKEVLIIDDKKEYGKKYGIEEAFLF